MRLISPQRGPRARWVIGAYAWLALCGAPAAYAQTAAPKIVLADAQTRYVGAVPRGASADARSASRTLPRAPADMLAEFAPYFGIADSRAELSEFRAEVTRDRDTVRRYRQMRYGVPVVGGELIMTTDAAGGFRALSGEVAATLRLDDVTPQITSAEARAIAIAAAVKYHGAAPFTLTATDPELSIYSAALLGPSSLSGAQLVWRVEVAAPGRPIRELVLVDARTGMLAQHFNQTDFVLDRLTYTAGNTDLLPGVLLCDETQPDCTGGLNPDADLAHLHAQHVHDFYLQRHERDSIDGAGATIISSVELGPAIECPNAFWDGSQVAFCPGGSAADDVVAHELTHAVTEHTSGLFYWYQSGAINESLSDVWGEIIDLTNGSGNDADEVRWQVGEDWQELGVIRDMANPPTFGDPDRMLSPHYWSAVVDNGGVHTNSGVNNKAASLLVDGGMFNGYSVAGIGIDDTAALYYRVQTQHLTSGSDYGDLYVALNQACQDLMGAGTLAADDCLQVANATNAVEMALEPDVSAGTEAAVCPPGQVPADAYANGFETLDDRALWTTARLSGAEGDWAAALLATDGVVGVYTPGAGTASDHVLEMSVSVVVPADAFLHFRHLFYQEFSGAMFYDGGFVEISTDEGATWKDAGDRYAAGHEYDGALVAGSGNPAAGREAFVADSRGFVSTRYDLADLAGSSLRVRFRNTSDESISTGLAWVVDEIRIYACADDATPNVDPVADAGADQTVAPLAAVTLDASGSRDDDGTIVAYDWTQLSGPAVTATAVGASLALEAPPTPVQEVLGFALTVTDNRGAVATDEVLVTVINEQPTADAGADADHAPEEAVVLAGTAADPDGTITSYSWLQLSGPTVSLQSANSATASFTAPAVVSSAALEFELRAIDDFGALAVDSVTVTVTNDQPVAEAGADQTAKPRTVVALAGSASDDAGGITAYAWIQTAGVAVTLTNADTPTPSFEAPSVATSSELMFEMTVTDKYGATATDTANVTVNNDPPVSNAGIDTEVAAGASVALNGSGADPDGTVASYAWTQLSGPPVSLSNASAAQAQFTAPSQASASTLTFRLRVTDNDGQATDDSVSIGVRAQESGGGGGVLGGWTLLALLILGYAAARREPASRQLVARHAVPGVAHHAKRCLFCEAVRRRGSRYRGYFARIT